MRIEELLIDGDVFVAIKTSTDGQSETVIGYALAGSWAFFARWPIFLFVLVRSLALNFGGRTITARSARQK